jgi:hypothetical protein
MADPGAHDPGCAIIADFIMNIAALFDFSPELTEGQRGNLNAELQIAGFSRVRGVPSFWLCRGRYEDLRSARHAFRNVFQACGLGMPHTFLIPFSELSELP